MAPDEREELGGEDVVCPQEVSVSTAAIHQGWRQLATSTRALTDLAAWIAGEEITSGVISGAAAPS